MKSLLFLVLLSSALSFAQDGGIIAKHKNDAELKIVLRTEEKLEDRYVQVDNLTIKVTGDSSKVYYMNYSDGMVSSLMIPFSVFDKYIKFEENLSEYHCLSDVCKYSILVEAG